MKTVSLKILFGPGFGFAICNFPMWWTRDTFGHFSNSLKLLALEKWVHQWIKMNHNQMLASFSRGRLESRSLNHPSAPICLASLLKFQKKKGGELEGMT